MRKIAQNYLVYFICVLFPDPQAPPLPKQCPPIPPKLQVGPCVFQEGVHCRGSGDCQAGERCCPTGCHSKCFQ